MFHTYGSVWMYLCEQIPEMLCTSLAPMDELEGKDFIWGNSNAQAT